MAGSSWAQWNIYTCYCLTLDWMNVNIWVQDCCLLGKRAQKSISISEFGSCSEPCEEVKVIAVGKQEATPPPIPYTLLLQYQFTARGEAQGISRVWCWGGSVFLLQPALGTVFVKADVKQDMQTVLLCVNTSWSSAGNNMSHIATGGSRSSQSSTTASFIPHYAHTPTQPQRYCRQAYRNVHMYAHLVTKSMASEGVGFIWHLKQTIKNSSFPNSKKFTAT